MPQALTSLLESTRHCNVRLNYEKLQYKQTEVELFGETYTVDGCKPAKGNVQTIVKMPAPSCKNEVQSFIGMINYLSKFSARLSELALPIRELAKEKVVFNWGGRTSSSLQAGEERDSCSTHIGILGPKEDHSITN